MVRKDEHTDVIPAEKPTPLGRAAEERDDDPTTSPASPPPAAADTATSAAAGPEHPCPHCGAEMIDHDAPEGTPKHNAWHCNACGGCFVHRGSAWFLLEGHVAPAGWTGNT